MSDHERFIRKAAAQARAYEIDQKDKKDKLQEEGKGGKKIGHCDGCGKDEVEIQRFRMSTTDRSEGVASFHIDNKWLCAACEPTPPQRKDAAKTKAQLKSMLKAARKGLGRR
jgi:hypothetical protein